MMMSFLIRDVTGVSRGTSRGVYQAPLRWRPVVLSAIWIALLVLLPPLGANADDTSVFESGEKPATLIELFTSEGCSSCPPADAWLGRLKASPDLWRIYVPVAFHVDYWNRLGWMDRFSSTEFTARQRRYAANGASDSVYTPEVILNGREWRGYFSGQPLPEAGATAVGRLKVTLRDRDRAEVVFSPVGKAPRPTQVEVALLGSNLESDVKRGENVGRKLHHDFVVLQFATAKLTPEGAQYVAVVSWKPGAIAAEPSAMAAWITSGDGLPPIQVVGGWLPTR